MSRFFVGLPVPPDCAERLLELRTSMPGIRWVAPESLHLTLRFMGDVEGSTLADIDEALREIRREPVLVQCQNLDVFEGAGNQPRAIIRRVNADAGLNALQRAVEQALSAFAMSGRRRRFKPHVTLARINRAVRRSGLQYCVEGTDLLPPVAWSADRFVLCSSHLGSQAAVYAEEASYPFASGAGRDRVAAHEA